jgi:uncharacterized short protein YbdD (DUF466 family)
MSRLTDLMRGTAEGGAIAALGEKATYLRETLMRVAGAPDYANYLARHRVIHPDVPAMTEAEFFRFAIARKYARSGPRCC